MNILNVLYDCWHMTASIADGLFGTEWIFELWFTLLLLSGVSLIALRPVKRRFPHRYPIAKKSSALLLAAELLLFGYVIQTGNIIYSLTDSPPTLQDVLAPLVPACVAFLSMLPLRRLWNALFPSYPPGKMAAVSAVFSARACHSRVRAFQHHCTAWVSYAFRRP